VYKDFFCLFQEQIILKQQYGNSSKEEFVSLLFLVVVAIENE